MADLAQTVHIDEVVLDYVARLTEATRDDSQTAIGASVRGGLALVRTAKVWAAAAGREYVIPDDVKDLAQPVLAHRLLLDTEAEFAGRHGDRDPRPDPRDDGTAGAAGGLIVGLRISPVGWGAVAVAALGLVLGRWFGWLELAALGCRADGRARSCRC